MNGVYLNDWSCKEDVCRDFCLTESDLYGAEILFANYTYENYIGNAVVIFRHAGKLYEVHGAHCSCYGLEDQWEPEETSIEALRMRRSYGPVFDALLASLDALPPPQEG